MANGSGNCLCEQSPRCARAAFAPQHLPACIIQGRYDVICPAKSAWRLHQAWPEARFQMIEDAGHAAFEPGICHALIEATQRFKLTGRL